MLRKIHSSKVCRRGPWRAKNQSGFIPMLIMIVLILVVFIWLVYTRVQSSH